MAKSTQPQGGKCSQNEGDISEVEIERLRFGPEAQESLERVRKTRESEKEDEVNDDFEWPRHKVIPEDAVMLQPKGADDGESNNERGDLRAIQYLRRAPGNVESGSEQGQAETENEIAKCFKAPREALVIAAFLRGDHSSGGSHSSMRFPSGSNAQPK